MKKKALLAVIPLVTVIYAIVASALMSSAPLSFNGSVRSINVAVYSDSACTIPCTTVNIGFVDAGGSVDYTVYVKNEGSVPMTLAMVVDSLSPSSAGAYLGLTWNQEGTVLDADASVASVLSLSVAGDIEGVASFSYSLIISGVNND